MWSTIWYVCVYRQSDNFVSDSCACVFACVCECVCVRVFEYTFRQTQPVIQTSLDHWFISLSLYKLVSKFDIVSSITTDHCGIQLQFRELKENYDFGTSYWKFNNSLFNENKIVDRLNTKIRE